MIGSNDLVTATNTIEVLVAMPTTRWEFRIVPCLARKKASATCLKMLVMRFVDVPAPLSFHSMFKGHYKCQVIILLLRTIMSDSN